MSAGKAVRKLAPCCAPTREVVGARLLVAARGAARLCFPYGSSCSQHHTSEPWQLFRNQAERLLGMQTWSSPAGGRRGCRSWGSSQAPFWMPDCCYSELLYPARCCSTSCCLLAAQTVAPRLFLTQLLLWRALLLAREHRVTKPHFIFERGVAECLSVSTLAPRDRRRQWAAAANPPVLFSAPTCVTPRNSVSKPVCG